MTVGEIYTLLLSSLILSLINATISEPSIAHTVFLPQVFDPFRDTYLETVTRMSINELMHLPKLNDTEFLDELMRGMDSLPVTARVGSNSLFDANIDEQLQYQGEIENEWEDLMAGGPASINLVGVVMTIASKKDFPLSPDFPYKFVKYPNSFHTTLVQVANDMHRALFGAHTAMDKILTNMRQIPTQLKTALKLITQASTTMIKTMLPRTLATLGRYANESATVARASLEKFEYLQELLAEIAEVSASTNKENQDKAMQIAAENEDMKKNKTDFDSAINSIKAAYEQSREYLEKARQDYHQAMLNVPGGQWSAHAWNVYAASRPAQTCERRWFWRRCRDNREEQFVQYTAEARQKAQDALDTLKRAEEHAKQLFDLQMEKQDEVALVINQLATINFDYISINETIKVLLDAAGKMALVREQWDRITRFFAKLAVDTSDTQQVILENFIGAIADAEKMGQPMSPIDQTLYVTLLVESATDIDRDSHLLFLTAKTYVDVSNEYMLDQIASISGLLYLQTDAARDTYLNQVMQKTAATTRKVKDLAADRQRKYQLANFARQAQYMDFMEQEIISESIYLSGAIGIGRR